MRWDPAGILNHSSKVHQIPRHERRVSIGELVFRTAGTGIEIRGSRPRRAQPSGVCLRWNDVTEVLQGVEYVHRAVFRTVFIAGDQASPHATVICILTLLVKVPRRRIQSFMTFVQTDDFSPSHIGEVITSMFATFTLS